MNALREGGRDVVVLYTKKIQDSLHIKRFFVIKPQSCFNLTEQIKAQKLLLGFCLRPVSEADAEGLGTTIFPTNPPTHPPLLLIFF
jgi:hypothetical protein